MIPEGWVRPATLAAAKVAQGEMAGRVVTEDALGDVRRLGGVDISSTRFDPERWVHAAVVVLDAGTLEVVETAGETARAAFPYVPGYLGFREVPALVEAWGRLAVRPELVLVDGQGVAHPRGLGVATQLGVVLDVPTIGVAKSVLVGRLDGELGESVGSRAALVWRGAVIGMALRTRVRAGPLYVSVGHRVSLATAVAWVERTGRGYRLPEPTRRAHEAAGALRRAVVK